MKPNAPKLKMCVHCAMAYTRCKVCVDASEFKPFGPNFCLTLQWSEIPEDNPLNDIPAHAVRSKR